MDAFQELGISAVAQDPGPRTVTRNVGEVLTTVVAGTALTACGIFAVLLAAFMALVMYTPVL
ncbi:MAG TPA: hypothetical protein VGF80_15780 [Galbitalea sp.]|jgi:hypothetical protein